MAQYEDEFPAPVRVSGRLQIVIRSVGKVRRCPMLSHQPIYIKYQDENNNILGVDTFELRCPKLVLELETRPRTEQFKSH